jgi:MFS_1 like family
MATLHAVSTIVPVIMVFRARPFTFLMGLVLTTEALKSPVPIVADAAVASVAAGPGEYGRCRMWGAVTWGGVSAISGAILEHYGFEVSMACYLLTSSTGARPRRCLSATRSLTACRHSVGCRWLL